MPFRRTIMNNFKQLLKSPHIQIALAIGFNIIILAYFSKRILPEPIGNLYLAIPPFIGTIFELLLGKYGGSRFCKTGYWAAAIFLSTAIVILLNL